MNKIDKLFQKADHVLIVVHTNPDPDAMASAFALRHILLKKYNVETSIGYSGTIGRAENQALVKEIGIYMKQISKINWEKYDCIAMVDTQPGSGNNVLPEDVQCHLVLDHHPVIRKVNAELSFIDKDLGVLATMLIEWIRALELEISPDLATALVYAINSETQYLKREVNQRDIDAYLYVYMRANLRKLARIEFPALPKSYFSSVSKALNKAKSYRNLVIVHMGSTKSAEIVPEMADFLVRHERISWALSTGRFKDRLVISLRSRNTKAQAGKLVRNLVRNSKTVGGHDTYAGGYVDITGMKENDVSIMENTMSKNFAELHNYENPIWKSLL
ncbi:MAG: DHH family phosphoesterase [Calditrichaeota bacterium]|nr:DHH family phosphoesterase [Calditrichota bacterium]